MNPVWEETAFLLLTDDEVKSDEELAVVGLFLGTMTRAEAL